MDAANPPYAANEPLVLAVPKGRILEEAQPLIAAAGIRPAPGFSDPSSRMLRFATNFPNLEIIRVRSFDELYAPLDLGIGRCRLSVAATRDLLDAEDPSRWSHVRVATKYPLTTRRHFATQGVQAECIKLNGAMELAPALGLCRRIVDLVSTGATLKANGLVEVEKIADVTSRLIVNRPAMKTRPAEIRHWVDAFTEAVEKGDAGAAA